MNHCRQVAGARSTISTPAVASSACSSAVAAAQHEALAGPSR